MTYWQFHLCFLLPALAALLGWHRWRRCPPPPRAWMGIAVVAAIALVYTTPWDDYLIRRGVWSYRPERVASGWRIGYVPLEEYLFFVLQPILTSLCLWGFVPSLPGGGPPGGWMVRPRLPRLAGGAAGGALVALGGMALAAGGRWLYAGLILVWGAPPLVLHWFYGGDVLWRSRHAATRAFGLATVYLWVADRTAIGAGIWSISPQHSTGWTFFGLPVEEALFFAVTNLLIIQALLLFWWRMNPNVIAPRPRP